MLKDLITSKTRVKILSLFLEDPSSMFHVREIVRRVEEEINAVRRELILLEKKGIFKKEKRGNRVYYYLDTAYPFYYDLIRTHAKEFGIGSDILKNRARLGRIRYAMLSGKYVRNLSGKDDVDLLIVGLVVLPELQAIVKKEEDKAGKEVNYTVMSEEEFNFRKSRRDPFIATVLYGSRIMLVGDEEKLIS